MPVRTLPGAPMQANPAVSTSGHCSDPVLLCAHHKLPKRLWRARFLDSAPLRYLRTGLQIWCMSFRSFRGHIGTLSSTQKTCVDLGPVLDCLPNGSYQQNTRTAARKQGIEILWAKRPRMGSVDLQMFLGGFDAGEQWCARTTGTEADKQTDDPSHLPPFGGIC